MSEETTIQALQQRIKQLEDALAERTIEDQREKSLAEHSRLALQFVNDGIFDWNLLTGEVYYSPGWKQLLGYEDHELPNQTSVWEQLTHHRDAATSRSMLTEALNSSKERFEVEYRMRHKKSHWVDILSRAKLVRDSSGKAVRLVGTHVDITERKKSQKALERRAEFERLISELSSYLISLGSDEVHEGIFYALKSIGEFTRADRAYIFQYKGQSLTRVANTHEWCAPGIDPQIDSLQDIVVAGELPWLSQKILKRESVIIPKVAALPPQARSERKHFQRQGILSLIVVPMVSEDRDMGFLGFDAVREARSWTNDDQSLLRLVGQTICHLLDRKRSEEALKASEERNRQILMTAMDGFWRVDGQGRLLEVNQAYCRMSGYERAELLDMGTDELEALQAADGLSEPMSLVNQTGKARFETRHRRKDGTYYDLEAAVQLLPAELGGECVYFFRDITQRKKAEEIQKRIFRQHVIAMDLAKLVYWEYDNQADLYTFDDNFYKLYGTSRSQQGGNRISSAEYANRFLPAGEASRVKKSLQEATEADSPDFMGQLEHKIVRPDGEERFISARYGVIKDDSGRTIKTYGANQDITERKRAEAELAAIFAMSLDMICIADMNSENFLKVNPAFTEILGYSEKELLEKTFFSFIHPDDIGLTKNILQSKLRQGRKVINFENRYRCKNGSYRWLSWVSHPRPEEGKTFAVGRDVTEWKKAKQQLEDNKRLLDATNRIARIGGWELDAATLQLSWTEETYNIHEMPLDHQPTLEDAIVFFHPQDRQELTRAIRAALEQTRPFDLELRFKSAKGRRLITRVTGEPLTQNGKVIKLRGICQDITEQRRAEQERKRLQHQLSQAQKMDALGTLSSGIAHDFNNLLAAIMGYSELALDALSPEHPVRFDLGQITKAAEKAKTLVRQILTFSRKSDVTKRPRDLNDVAREALTILERTVPKMISIEFNPQKGLKPVLVDQQQIEQVILNLGTNAADAIPEAGTISIFTENLTAENMLCDVCGNYFSGEYVALMVQDDGIGISPEAKSRIFDPFFTTKEIGKGTGLGLSTVFGIISGHGGHISCTSQEGTGTTFRILLPADDTRIVRPEQDKADGTQRLNGTETLLVVDDEETIRDIAHRMLCAHGYRVILADSGEEALHIHRENPGRIQATLMDLGMPGMGGKACIAQLRQMQPQAKVLITSGYIQYELTDELKKLGAAGMVSKPYNATELLRTVRSLLDS